MGLIDLSGRNALVTGGSRGVGAATAIMLAEAGANVAVAYRSRAEDAQRVVDACRERDVEAWAAAGSVVRQS